MRLVLIGVAVATLCSGPALADVFDECHAAIEENDTQAAKRAADALLVGTGTEVPEEHLELAARCIQMGRDRPYEFSKLTRRFRTPERATEENLQFARQRAQANVREKQKEQDEEARKAQSERESKVVGRLVAACYKLYRIDPDTTIINKQCFDVFLANGLPDD